MEESFGGNRLGAFDVLTWHSLRDSVLRPCVFVAVGALIGWAVHHRLRKMIENGRVAEDTFFGILLRSIGKLPIVWGLLMGLNWATRIISLPPFAQDRVVNLLFAVLIWTVMTFLQRAIGQFISRRMVSEGSPVATSLLMNLVSAAIYLTGIILVLDEFDISITPMITALGIGGMAIALGLQETMANIFAGLHILLTKQVRIGDNIKLEGGSEGKIIDITWRYAKIHTVMNNIIIVPNSKLASSIITNYDMDSVRGQSASVMDVAFVVTVGVAYDSDLEEVERVTLEVAREVLKRLDPDLDISDGASTAPVVRFHTFGESSINFNVNLHTTSFKGQYVVRHEFIKALKKRYDEERIRIPFPVRTVQLDGSLSTK